jgi:hypothetical protein
MSVHCRIIAGPTVEIKKNLTHADFKKYHDFIDKHPELEDDYNRLHLPGDKLILFADGMNGCYERLVYVQKVTEDARLSRNSDMEELNVPITEEIITLMQSVYKEYTGQDLMPDAIRYCLWTQWT